MGRGLRPGISQKHGAIDLHEAGQRQRADHGKGRHRDHGQHRMTDHDHVQQSEIDKQLADESIERRQSADRNGPRDKHRRRPRHALGQSSERIDLPRMRRVNHGAGAEKQQRFEQTMIPDMQQASGQAQHHPFGLTGGTSQQRDAEPHQDDADVLDAVIGEKPFEIVLGDREDDAEQPADHAQQKNQPTPEIGRIRQQRQKPHESVNAHFDHDAG